MKPTSDSKQKTNLVTVFWLYLQKADDVMLNSEQTGLQP